MGEANAQEPIPDTAIDDEDEDAYQRKWEALIEVYLDVLQETPILAIGQALVFSSNPKTQGPYEYEYSHSHSHEDEYNQETGFGQLDGGPNTGPYALDGRNPNNRAYIERESALWNICRTLESLRRTPRVLELYSEAYRSLYSLAREKAFQWETQRGGHLGGPCFNTEIFYHRRTPKSRVTDTASLVSLALQYQYFLPRRGCEAYLASASDLLSSFRKTPSASVTPELPLDPRPLSLRFNLDPITSSYISCPSCHCLYPYDIGSKDVAEHCTFKRTPSSLECGASLWKWVKRGPLGMVKVPCRKYIHQHLKPWLGRCLSREGIEHIAHDYPRTLMEQPPGEATDIWQGDVFRKLKDPGGPNTPFFPGPPGELRLAFSISIDGFHPFQMKPAGQNATSTGIWLVLLNLPWHLRYRPENIYLAGVIPGPHKPSNDQINHYIQLVVDDFKELYSGIHFSRTHDYRGGRTCRGMVIPVVCDLLGAHQVVGYPGAPTAHYFCTCCELDIDDINVIDPHEWPKKDIRHIRRYAQIYRNADSERHQQAVFEGCGWRWSPLFELVYWDPSIFTVVDSMHAIDINLIKNHVHNLFQIDTLPGHHRGDALRPPTLERVKRVIAAKSEINALEKCQHTIFENPPDLLYHLLKFHRKILYSFCLDYQIRSPEGSMVVGTRWVLARGIHRWRQDPRSSSVSTFLKQYPRLSPQQLALMDEDTGSETDDDSIQEEGEEDDPGEDTFPEGVRSGVHDGVPSVREEEREAEHPLRTQPKMSVLRRNAMKLLEYVESDGTNDDKPLFDKLTVVILKHFCNILSLDPSGGDSEASGKKITPKRMLFNVLVDALKLDGQKKAQLLNHFSKDIPIVSSSAAFLGVDVMEEVWKDMGRIRLPSWITSAPRDWGTSHRGKLSADNWRVICCIHLPITLLRLFGSSEGRTHDLVDNFMQLVCAARIATMWTSSPAHVKAYNDRIFSYTRGALDLYPDYSVLPSHHAALHIGDMLHRFGPKHSHDSPYYERYIRFFHRMNTNNKLGEVEATLLRTAMRSVNLLVLLDESPEARDLVQSMVHRLQVQQKEGHRGFRLAETIDPPGGLDSVPVAQLTAEAASQNGGTLKDVPPSVLPLLCDLLRSKFQDPDQRISPRAVFLEAVPHRNNTYAIWNSRRYRDSSILFKREQGEEAGVIQAIFVHQHRMSSGEVLTDTYVAIDMFERVDKDDRFGRYGNAGGFCCKPIPALKQLIPLQHVLCHVAVTEFEEEGIVHILPVNRTTLSLELIE